MWAVVEIGTKQYKVRKGDTIEVERLNTQESTISIDKVLLYVDDNNIEIGTPYIGTRKVTAQVLGEEKGKKIIVYKFKRRKKYRRKYGHRQIYTRLKIVDIV